MLTSVNWLGSVVQDSGAEKRRGKSEMSMLDEVAAEAVALAEMLTEQVDLPTAVESMEAETIKMVGRIVKRLAVATGEDGGQAECPRVVEDCENTAYKDNLNCLHYFVWFSEKKTHTYFLDIACILYIMRSRWPIGLVVLFSFSFFAPCSCFHFYPILRCLSILFSLWHRLQGWNSWLCVGRSCGRNGSETVDLVWTSRESCGTTSEHWSVAASDHTVCDRAKPGHADARCAKPW